MAIKQSTSLQRYRRSESEIKALLAAQEQGSHNVKEFCKVHHLSRGVFYYWRSKYSATLITPAFTPIDLSSTGSDEGAFAEIVFPGNRVVRLFRDVDPSYLKAILAP